MKTLLLTVFGYILLNLLIPKAWDQFLESSPLWLRNVVLLSIAVLGLVCLAFIEPARGWLHQPRAHPISSTATAVLMGAMLTGSVWWIYFAQPKVDRGGKVILKAGNEPFPMLPVPPGMPPHFPRSAIEIGPNEVTLILGGLVVSTPQQKFTVLNLYGKDLLTLAVTDDGLVRLWIDVWDDDGRLIATIEDSILRLNQNNSLPILRPNPSTLIIQNQRKESVLDIRFLNPRTIKIQGIFKAGGKYPVLIGDSEIVFGPLVIGTGVALHLQGKTLFEWPGSIKDAVYIKSGDQIPVDGAILGFATNDGAMNVVLKNQRGEAFSLLQIGGKDVPPGTEIVPGFSFWLRDVK